MRVVILGGGVAGTTASEELRKGSKDLEIVLVSEEQHPLYSRVLLPFYVSGAIPREKVFLKKESWYEEHGIEWISGTRVEEIDPKNKHVALSDGRELPYDCLIIASGVQPELIEEDRRGVSYLRTLDDADHLFGLLSEATRKTKALVFGGSFIACEYLDLFTKAGLETTVAFRGTWFWSRILDEASGEMINAHMRAKGVTVLPKTTLVSIAGEKAIEYVETSQGKISCGLLGIGLGVGPELSLARDAEIATNEGILANEFFETSVKDIFAIGDIAEINDLSVGRQRVVRTWQNAMSQGRAVAKNILGERVPFDQVTSFGAAALGLKVVFVGDTSRAHADEILVRGTGPETGVTQLFLRKKRLVGATIVGRNQDRAYITQKIASKSTDFSF